MIQLKAAARADPITALHTTATIVETQARITQNKAIYNTRVGSSFGDITKKVLLRKNECQLNRLISIKVYNESMTSS